MPLYPPSPTIPASPNLSHAVSLPAASPLVTGTVTVNTDGTLATVPATAIGLNIAVSAQYTSGMGASTTALWNPIATLAPGLIRLPGGSLGDYYDWQHNALTISSPPVGFPQSVHAQNTYNALIDQARSVLPGVAIDITANYGSSYTAISNSALGGSTSAAVQDAPQIAANWVANCNKNNVGFITTGGAGSTFTAPATSHAYGVRYWTVGNEQYGAQNIARYGRGNWEINWWISAANTPMRTAALDYVTRAKTYISLMRGVDSSIKIGVPIDWPADPGYVPDWNDAVIAGLAPLVDFIDTHVYNQATTVTDDRALYSARIARQGIRELRAHLDACGGTSVEIHVNETSTCDYNPGPQTITTVAALFASDNTVALLEEGAKAVCWFTQMAGPQSGVNGLTMPLPAYNPQNLTYGDFGILSSGYSINGTAEPTLGTPFPPYYGLLILNSFMGAGDVLVPCGSTALRVAVHAARRIGGALTLLYINRDNSPVTIQTTLNGSHTPTATWTRTRYDTTTTTLATDTFSSLGTTFTLRLTPYSVTCISL